MRDGKLTEDDWKTLLDRNPQTIKKPENFDDFIRLFGTNKESSEWNLKKLCDLDTKIAKIVVRHSDKVAMNSSSKLPWGLQPVLYFAVGPVVMLRMNLCTTHGLVNDAIGKIKDIVYNEGEGPDRMPRAIIVEFDD